MCLQECFLEVCVVFCRGFLDGYKAKLFCQCAHVFVRDPGFQITLVHHCSSSVIIIISVWLRGQLRAVDEKQPERNNRGVTHTQTRTRIHTHRHTHTHAHTQASKQATNNNVAFLAAAGVTPCSRREPLGWAPYQGCSLGPAPLWPTRALDQTTLAPRCQTQRALRLRP